LSLKAISVNVSAVEFRQANFAAGVFAILEDTGLEPAVLELELTEGVFMKQAKSTAFTLKALREKGIRVSLDDFGTGYSSLSYLRKFPVDALKIDRSLVHQIETGDDDAATDAAVISMARSLRLAVIAEGVETAKELEFLRAQQCGEAQGFYFSPAVNA